MKMCSRYKSWLCFPPAYYIRVVCNSLHASVCLQLNESALSRLSVTTQQQHHPLTHWDHICAPPVTHTHRFVCGLLTSGVPLSSLLLSTRISFPPPPQSSCCAQEKPPGGSGATWVFLCATHIVKWSSHQPEQCGDDVVHGWVCAELVVPHWMLNLLVLGHDCGAKKLLDVWGHTWRTELQVHLFFSSNFFSFLLPFLPILSFPVLFSFPLLTFSISSPLFVSLSFVLAPLLLASPVFCSLLVSPSQLTSFPLISTVHPLFLSFFPFLSFPHLLHSLKFICFLPFSVLPPISCLPFLSFSTTSHISSSALLFFSPFLLSVSHLSSVDVDAENKCQHKSCSTV